jgi:aminoglycoside 6'-N-acetyltransferase
MPDSLPVLRTGRLMLRPLAEDDLDALLAIVTGPTVREWWGTIDDLDYEREGLRSDGNAFTIEVDGTIAGWLAFTEENEPDYRYASLDIALAPGSQGTGIGPAALRTAIDWLVEERGHRRFTIDPAVANERAIRAYEKVGFQRVGVMRKCERFPDGTWHDALLMDLLAEEL